MYYHRSEHWVIVSGTAKIEINNETFILNENESTYVPKGANIDYQILFSPSNFGGSSKELI